MALSAFKVGFPPLTLGKPRLAAGREGRRWRAGASTNRGEGHRTLPTTAWLSWGGTSDNSPPCGLGPICQRPHGFLGEGRQITAHHAVLAPSANTSLLVVGHLFLVNLAQCAPTVDVSHLRRPDADCVEGALVRFGLRVVRDLGLSIVALEDVDLVPIWGRDRSGKGSPSKCHREKKYNAKTPILHTSTLAWRMAATYSSLPCWFVLPRFMVMTKAMHLVGPSRSYSRLNRSGSSSIHLDSPGPRIDAQVGNPGGAVGWMGRQRARKTSDKLHMALFVAVVECVCTAVLESLSLPGNFVAIDIAQKCSKDPASRMGMRVNMQSRLAFPHIHDGLDVSQDGLFSQRNGCIGFSSTPLIATRNNDLRQVEDELSFMDNHTIRELPGLEAPFLSWMCYYVMFAYDLQYDRMLSFKLTFHSSCRLIYALVVLAARYRVFSTMTDCMARSMAVLLRISF